MTPSVTTSDAVNVKDSEADSTQLRKRLVEEQSGHPALSRLRQRIEGLSADSGVVTDYSRMHHRHSRA